MTDLSFSKNITWVKPPMHRENVKVLNALFKGGLFKDKNLSEKFVQTLEAFIGMFRDMLRTTADADTVEAALSLIRISQKAIEYIDRFYKNDTPTPAVNTLRRGSI